MPFFTAEQFCRRHGGFDGLTRFIGYLEQGCPDCQHKKSRCTLEHIAREFSLSISEVCQLRRKLMVQVWEPQEGLRNYLRFHESNAEDSLKEKRAIILRLGHGRSAG